MAYFAPGLRTHHLKDMKQLNRSNKIACVCQGRLRKILEPAQYDQIFSCLPEVNSKP